MSTSNIKKQNIKIFVTHTMNSKNYVYENNIIKPVFKTKESSIPKELAGKNSKHINDAFSELTTQYWAWKNVEADYYGFMHYRRFLSFADEQFGVDNWSNVVRNYLNDKAIDEIGLSDEQKITKIVSKYDIIAPVHVDLTKTEFSSVYDHYQKAPKLHIEDLDLMLDLIKKHAHKYYDAAINYVKGTKCYLCNIFIMKKELFEEYNQFLFLILKLFNQERDMSNYSVEAYRTPGHLGERLFGIFCSYIESLHKYKIKEREMVVYLHPKAQEVLKPAFKNNNIPVIFSTSSYYAKFASASIKSLIDNSSNKYNYDIIIMGKDFNSVDKERLNSLRQMKDNVSIRFYDVGMFFDNYRLYESPTISVETYYRLVIPDVFDTYDKVLYLDCDLIVLKDISKLYEIDIGDNYLAAVRDITFQGNINGGNKEFNTYYSKFKCKDLNFFNAGVLIMNTKKIRNNFSVNYLLDFAQQGAFRFQDQDLLNILFEGFIYELGYEWNFYGDPMDNSYRMWINTFAPKDYYEKYLDAKKQMYIIHYAGNEKPWLYPKQQYAELFWEYFRGTPYYEEYMFEMASSIGAFHANNIYTALKDKKSEVHVNNNTPKKHGKFEWLLPKGSRRREFVKKIVCKLSGKEYIEPNYEVEGIVPKYKKKKNEHK